MIHSTAIVSPHAIIGNNVSVGPFTVIHDNVHVGDNTRIDGFCELGYSGKLASGRALVIGRNSIIRSHSVFYAGSSFKDGLVTGHRVTVRENTMAGLNFQIGTLCDFQGDCELGDYVRTHSNVHIGKASKVGNFVWIYPYVVLTNDPHPPSDEVIGVTIKDYAVVATMSVLLPGVIVNEHALVAAHSMVNRDVPAYTVVGGSPAKELCKTSVVKLKNGAGSAYPWPAHFHRGYPDAIVEKWRLEFSMETPGE